MVYLKFSYFVRTDDDYNTVNWYAILVKEDGKWRIREFNPLESKNKISSPVAEMRIVLEQKDITVLAIESSCDETAAAVVVNGRKVLSNIIASQIDIHKLYGGVVPEIASRKHIEKINQVIDEALTEAGKTLMTWTQSASLMVPVWLELYWWVLVLQKQLVMQQISLLLACIILKDTYRQIT